VHRRDAGSRHARPWGRRQPSKGCQRLRAERASEALGSGEHEADIDVISSRVRIRTDHVRLVDQRLGHVRSEARE
jgi:hypothetical protein